MSWKVYVHWVPNGKVYVGITSMNVEDRWRADGSGYAGQLFYRAIEKYGWENITHRILAEVETQQEAENLEVQYIEQFNSTDRSFGYNVCSGGYVNAGFHFNHTPEAKLKISEASKGRPVSEAQRQRLREARRNFKQTEIAKERIRLAALSMSQETKDKISEAVKARWQEGRYANRKLPSTSPWNKGLTKEDPRVAKYARQTGEFKHTDESKRKMSEAKKGKLPHNAKRVMCVETGVEYVSASDACRRTGINNITLAANDSTKTAGGYHWRYL